MPQNLPITAQWLEEIGFSHRTLLGGVEFWSITLKPGECWLQLREWRGRWIASISWRAADQAPLPRSLTSRRQVRKLARVLGARLNRISYVTGV